MDQKKSFLEIFKAIHAHLTNIEQQFDINHSSWSVVMMLVENNLAALLGMPNGIELPESFHIRNNKTSSPVWCLQPYMSIRDDNNTSIELELSIAYNSEEYDAVSEVGESVSSEDVSDTEMEEGETDSSGDEIIEIIDSEDEIKG